jgi:hypothetical protein
LFVLTVEGVSSVSGDFILLFIHEHRFFAFKVTDILECMLFYMTISRAISPHSSKLQLVKCVGNGEYHLFIKATACRKINRYNANELFNKA